MRHEDFIKTLSDRNIIHEMNGDNIIVCSTNGNVYLGSLTTLPENVKFENQGNVYLGSLTTLPENVKFESWKSDYSS